MLERFIKSLKINSIYSINNVASNFIFKPTKMKYILPQKVRPNTKSAREEIRVH